MDGTGIIDVSASGSYQYQAYSIENPTTDLTQAAQMYGGGGPSRSGENVTPRRSLSVSAVWQAISLISGDIAKLPLHFYRRDDANGRQRLRAHPAAKLVRKRPNPEMTAFKFWRRTMALLLLYNNAYVWIQRNRLGVPVNLWPLLPSHTWVRRDDGQLFYHSIVDEKLETFFPEEVLHFEGICIDNTCGEEMVNHARDEFGLALARTGYASTFFRNGGRFGGVLEVPTAMKDPARKKVEEGFRNLYENVENAFKTFVARDNVKFHAGQHSPEQAQVVEGSRESNRDVARRYNLHPSKVGEEHKSAYNSKAEDNRDYLDTTLSPHLTQIVEELAFKLLSTREFESDDFYFEHNTDRLLQLDALKRAQQYGLLRRNEIISPNEARQRENLPPRTDPGGDDYSNPNTKSNTAGVNPEARSAHRKLLTDTIARTLSVAAKKIAREADNPGNFRSFCDTKLASVLLAVSDAVEPVIDAYTSVSGQSSDDLKLAFKAHLLRAITERLDIKATAKLKDAVMEQLDNYQETAADDLASVVIAA